MAKMIVQRAQISEKDVVLEIGAGLGALTIPAARVAKKLYAIEKDPRIMTVLKGQVFSNCVSNISLIRGNILQVDIKALGKGTDNGLVVLGNLP
ncbi:MAG: rRNA adenine N-6-methyltransferase family protein, partial [Desulfobacterales bacterium]